MSKFQIGDHVFWHSTSAGSRTMKVGVVTEVIPPGIRPKSGGALPLPGCARDHESYIVRAAPESTKRKRRYWPRVGGLQRLEGPDA